MKEILLTQGKVALVDDEDFDRVNQFKWHAQHSRNSWYACRMLPSLNGARKSQHLHTFLMLGPFHIDHISGDGLDNQKHNLRPATNGQNQMNRRKQPVCSSSFKGVSWHRRNEIWCARINLDRQVIHLGYYESETDAAHVYDYAAKIHFGEFARLNFP